MALGALLRGPEGAAVGAFAGFAGAAGLHRVFERRWERIARALAVPFPDEWRGFLLSRCDNYDRLPFELRERFERDVQIFLATIRITGIGVTLDDELRLLVASSAVTLSLGWPDYDWDGLTEVLLYPDSFDRDYNFGVHEIAGQASGWGTVILSVPVLRTSFADPEDGYHVGFHEFAHVLDLEQTQFDGIPVGLPPGRVEEWVTLMRKEMERLRRGKSVLDPYGGENPPEFFAVAVESFFEIPYAVRERHRELYALLRDYFQQDPAAWDDTRG
jgi:Mlc titration factor MtfA (ptsG expression regulator)